MNRRRFMQTTAGAAAFFGLSRRGYSFGQSPAGITKFTVDLPGLGPAGIPVLTANTTKYPGTDYYEVVARQFTQTLHPAIGPTKFWGYADAAKVNGEYSSRYLGGAIVAKRNRPVKLKITNLLPPTHILPVDSTVIDPTMEAEVGGRVDRIAVHLHGGFVHWTSDGGPFAWFSNASRGNGGFVHGSSFLNDAGPGAALYDYPNNQSARFLWYHDHAYGNTRLNAYAGLASAYLVTDDAETQLIKSGVLPNIGGYPLGIPLVIQDKTFQSDGSLFYPSVYEGNSAGATGRWDLEPGKTPPFPSAVPEFFADTILVNGAPYPKLSVTPRRFRFRLLNGSQARFFNLQLYVADGTADGITLRESSEMDPSNNIPLQIPTNAPGPKIIQIGTEGGFLPAPVVHNSPPKPLGYYVNLNDATDPKNGNVNRYNLLLAPAERADVIIDFRGFENKKVILYNDASAPFPGGDIRNDYYAGAPDLTAIGGVSSPPEGSGPDTRILMRFDVGASGGVTELTFDQTLNALKGALPIAYLLTQPPPPSTRADPQVKTLNEDFDSYGRLIQKLGAVVPGGIDYLAIPTEVAHKGEVQIWRIYNLTGDVHPMHFHLVDVTILKREAWQWTTDSDGNTVPALPLTPIPGTARLADPNERGWKETVRMNPGEVVTVAMKFDLPAGHVPDSPRLHGSYGIHGAEYVWHCHILEHEEHDMMHALVVL